MIAGSDGGPHVLVAVFQKLTRVAVQVPAVEGEHVPRLPARRTSGAGADFDRRQGGRRRTHLGDRHRGRRDRIEPTACRVVTPPGRGAVHRPDLHDKLPVDDVGRDQVRGVRRWTRSDQRPALGPEVQRCCLLGADRTLRPSTVHRLRVGVTGVASHDQFIPDHTPVAVAVGNLNGGGGSVVHENVSASNTAPSSVTDCIPVRSGRIEPQATRSLPWLPTICGDPARGPQEGPGRPSPPELLLSRPGLPWSTPP